MERFHKWKREIIAKLQSIQDVDALESYSDNMIEDITNKETFNLTFELMLQAKEIAEREG
ncbi:hypothetical protein [Enterococcus casseliflavus]|jgi:phage anti-repressor protein|uniref:hypothetical protein n=1 Tax=Enterococcus casseliflavus TaxID=37734 RepID=UPI002953CCBD|nr:hypothetical protein [Enterococcus casseliflavus]MDV7690035.1 hypothetical protein [Enterococcus casseliflavus]